MCIASAMTGTMRPSAIQIRLEADLPAFHSFYLEQVVALANYHGVAVRIAVFKSTGVRDSRDWQIANCKTPYLWMVDDDVVLDAKCLEAYLTVIRKDSPTAYYAGSKGDVNNRRNYPRFSMQEKRLADLGENSNHSHFYNIAECWNSIAVTRVLDTGNVVFNLAPIKAKGLKFRQFVDQANPSGDATTFSLVLDHAGLFGVFVPSARAYHLEKDGGGFNEFEARREMLLRTCDAKGFDKGVVNQYFMP